MVEKENIVEKVTIEESRIHEKKKIPVKSNVFKRKVKFKVEPGDDTLDIEEKGLASPFTLIPFEEYSPKT